jgi:hypothetical protein
LALTNSQKEASVLDSEIRASDAEREQTIVRLHEACGEGRLSLDEFSERTKAVFTARTRGDLIPITADLPRAFGALPYRPSRGRTIVALLSDVKRKGRWHADGETKAITILASCTLDLRNALIYGDEIVITTYVVMGSVKIVVPRGIRVELEGFALMGSRDSKVDDDEILPGAPIVRVRGVTIMGSVDVVSDQRQWSGASLPRPERPRLA